MNEIIDNDVEEVTAELELESVDIKQDEKAEEKAIDINAEEFKYLKAIIEALLMASEKPLTVKQVIEVLDAHNDDVNTRVKDKVKYSKKYILLALDELIIDLEDRAVEIKLLGNGYRIQTKAQFATWVQRLWQEKPSKYSKATMETLAIIAYRQPITRGEIEHIRGVAVSSQIIRNLLDRDWVKVVGHKELPGRPAIYATTSQFLADLNLEKLEDLPTLADIKEIKQDLFAGMDDVEGADTNSPQTKELDAQDVDGNHSQDNISDGEIDDVTEIAAETGDESFNEISEDEISDAVDPSSCMEVSIGVVSNDEIVDNHELNSDEESNDINKQDIE